MTAIHKRIGEMPTLIICLVLWVALFSLVLLISGNVSYLSGFLLGAAGSALYVYLLHYRVTALLTLPLTPDAAPPGTGRIGRLRSDSLKYLRSGWVKTIQLIVAGILLILAVSHFFHSVSFMAALFGFFSFQISLFFYAVLISIDQFFG